MNQNSVGGWFSSQFRETPWTAWLITANVTTFLLGFFGVSKIPQILSGELSLQTAWVWLTYPLVTPMQVHWFLLFLYAFWWIGTSLERQWGSQKFGRVFVVLTLLNSVAMWLGFALQFRSLTPVASPTFGLILPEITLFCIWGALNPEATVLFFFVIPVQAKYLAWGQTILSYFALGQFTGPTIPLFILPLAAAGWFWAKHDMRSGGRPGKSLSQRFQEKKREAQKSRFKVLPGKGLETAGESSPDVNLRAVRRAEEEKKKSAEQAELDRILDKIRFEGMEALSPAEKATLDGHSKKLNET